MSDWQPIEIVFARHWISAGLLPEGFASFTFLLFGFVFFGLLLLWRLFGGRW